MFVKEFENNIVIKTPDISEFENVWKAEEAAWSILAPVPGQKDALKCALSIFPDGFLSIYVDGIIAGNCYTSRLNYDMENPIRTWEEVADNGKGTNHVVDGKTLYVLTLGVSPEFQGNRLGEKLIHAQQENCVKLGCKRLLLGCRVPEYHKHSEIKIEDYMKWKDENNKFFDKELRFYDKCGMKFIKPLPEYMSGDNADPDSLNYGILSVWEAPPK